MGTIDYKHIFIVDDNEMFTQMLSDHLTKNPKYKISVFHTGEECINNLFQNPDLIILDYYLNDVSSNAADGLEILLEIKKYDERIQVIILSSQEHYGVALQTIARGASLYVMKDDHAFKKIDHFLKELG
jgi:DNA-binding NarL/FixJ family response regulator